MATNPDRAEAERLLGISEKLLRNRDLNGSREFAILAQETEPLLEGSDQILAINDVLLAAEKRVSNQHDWYSILQLELRCVDQDVIKKQYRKLALLLHPDKNKYVLADEAFQLVSDAWGVLSDYSKKSLYDSELTLFSKVDLSHIQKLPVRKSQIQKQTTVRKTSAESARSKQSETESARSKQKETESARSKQSETESARSKQTETESARSKQTESEEERMRLSTFWTTCPYCYNLYEYPRVYENCCLRCQNCQKAFHAASILSMPPLVPGQEAYYCSWAFFPLGYVLGGAEDGGKAKTTEKTAAFPNWMPPIFSGEKQDGGSGPSGTVAVDVNGRDTVVPDVNGNEEVMIEASNNTAGNKRGRGRPRKNGM